MKPYKVTVVVYVNADNISDVEKRVTEIVNSGDQVTGSEVTYIREDNHIAYIPSTSITPMEFDEFSKKYTDYRCKAGDVTNPEDLTAAYAVYCSDPSGHWISKVKK